MSQLIKLHKLNTYSLLCVTYIPVKLYKFETKRAFRCAVEGFGSAQSRGEGLGEDDLGDRVTWCDDLLEESAQAGRSWGYWPHLCPAEAGVAPPPPPRMQEGKASAGHCSQAGGGLWDLGWCGCRQAAWPTWGRGQGGNPVMVTLHTTYILIYVYTYSFRHTHIAISIHIGTYLYRLTCTHIYSYNVHILILYMYIMYMLIHIYIFINIYISTHTYFNFYFVLRFPNQKLYFGKGEIKRKIAIKVL